MHIQHTVAVFIIQTIHKICASWLAAAFTAGNNELVCCERGHWNCSITAPPGVH